MCEKGLENIAEASGGYPHGYIKTADTYDITRDLSFDINSKLTRGQAAVLLYNSNMNFYILNKRVFGDYYNGYVYVKTEPQAWQGTANNSEIFDIKLNVFRKLLPQEVKISTDGIEYQTVIRSDESKIEYLKLPKDKSYINNYSFDPSSGCFVCIDNLVPTAYSYDLTTWYSGSPVGYESHENTNDPTLNNLPINSENKKIVAHNSDNSAIMVMEVSDTIHADSTYYNTDYITHVGYHLYISKDGQTWDNVILPSNALYATDIYLNADNKSFVVSCQVPLNDDEKRYVNELEIEAKAEGKIYDKPTSKNEIYMIPFEDI